MSLRGPFKVQRGNPFEIYKFDLYKSEFVSNKLVSVFILLLPWINVNEGVKG